MFPLFLRLSDRKVLDPYISTSQTEIRNFYYKNDRHLYLITHIFTKLSQNMCLINSHTLMYWYARCNCKLCCVPWFYCIFWVFSYTIDEYSCLKSFIFNKLSQIICLINVHILVCQFAKCDCMLWINWIFSGNFHILLHVWNV